jgi:hypothetical protein
MPRLRALLATLRIANAPSVAGNVWLGFMLGRILWGKGWDRLETWHAPGLLVAAGLLIYFAGNLANDWFDRTWDETRRPERALPSGLFQARSYLIAAIVTAATGLLLATAVRLECGLCAMAILALVALYTRIHKRTLWSVVPMGLCRAGLYVLGFLASWPAWDHVSSSPETFRVIAVLATLASGLFSYIAGLSLSARYEGMASPPPGPLVISKALLLLPVGAMSCWFMPRYPLFGLLGMAPFLIWLGLCLTRFRRPIPRYVSALLAGIPLVDFIAAAPLALGLPSMLWGEYRKVTEFPHLTVLLILPLAAFVLGRLLQKVAPAT